MLKEGNLAELLGPKEKGGSDEGRKFRIARQGSGRGLPQS